MKRLVERVVRFRMWILNLILTLGNRPIVTAEISP